MIFQFTRKVLIKQQIIYSNEFDLFVELFEITTKNNNKN